MKMKLMEMEKYEIVKKNIHLSGLQRSAFI